MAKILFVTNDAWFFVSHRLPIAKACVARGDECIVAAKADDTVEAIEKAGVSFANWNIAPRGLSLFGEIRTFLSLVQIVKTYKPDVIHLITIKPVLYGGMISRLLRVPCCVYAISGLGSVFRSKGTKSSLLKQLILPFYKLAISHKNGRLIFQNPDDRESLISKLNSNKLQTTLIKGSGVDLNEFSRFDEPAGTPVVVMAARLLKDKGVTEFVDAAEILKGDGLIAKFVIAGGNVAEGNPGAFTSQELSELHNSSAVEFIGHCTDIVSLFKDATMVVLPSYHEGLPKVLVEAAASYRPVITTDVPGCRDALIPDKTGLVVPVRNAQALADAIKKLVVNKQLRQQMGEAGRKFVEDEMSINMVVSRHFEIYDELQSKVNGVTNFDGQ